MRRSWRIATRPLSIACVMALTVWACGPAIQSLPNDVANHATAPLVIRNDSVEVLCYVYATPLETERGLDLLDVDDVIAPGEERAFEPVGRGDHRIEMLDCNRAQVFDRVLSITDSGTHIWFRSRQ